MTEPTESSGLHAGADIVGRYRLVEPIGEGAMGSVWSAIHTSLGHKVAVKFLHGSVANSQEPRARFEREARLAAKLGEASRHITRVTDHGVTPDGTPFLVMEHLQGEGLEVRLKRERRLPITLCAKITTQLSKALHVAHGSGVIHRDLKPANVFLCESEDGEILVKLLDFGVAKATQDQQEENQATRAGALIGTPNFMSPEQIAGDHGVDARSDLWALAAIVYRMAVGRTPFGSGSLSELAMRILATEPAAPTSLAPDLPHEFDLWVKKGLAKKADDRFQTARELTDSLAMVAGLSLNSATTGAFSSSAAEALALQIGDSVGGVQATMHSHRPPKKKTGLWVALGAVAVLGIGGVVLVLASGGANKAGPAKQPETTAEPKNEPKKAVDSKLEESKKDDTTPKKDDTAKKDDTGVKKDEPKADDAKKPVKVAGPLVGKKPVTPVGTVAAPPVTPPPVVVPPPEATSKSGDLWKKKDEM